MKNLSRIPVLAMILLVVLRMSIGWQFLYEGLWKHNTLDSANPWTSEGYLKNAQGPFREYFRDMTGDPYELDWLDYESMSSRWYAWRDAFIAHYGLDQPQQDALNRLVDGAPNVDSAPSEVPPTPVIRQALKQLPEGVTEDQFEGLITYDPESGSLQASEPLLPSEEASLLSLVDVTVVTDDLGDEMLMRRSDPSQEPDATAMEYYKAVQRLATITRQLSYRHRLAAALRGDPEIVGVTGTLNERGTYDFVMGTTSLADAEDGEHVVRYGKIQEYKDLVEDYERAVAQAKIDYQNEHATMLGRKVALMRSELVGPIRQMDRSLKDAALDLLTQEQLAKGALPNQSPVAQADRQVMWGLIILGCLLIAGFFTRIAAVAGAIMLFMFYMVIPPWPGVPEPPGLTEHAYIVNKNFIESIALLGIAAMPTGSWFGLDGLVYKWWKSRRS